MELVRCEDRLVGGSVIAVTVNVLTYIAAGYLFMEKWYSRLNYSVSALRSVVVPSRMNPKRVVLVLVVDWTNSPPWLQIHGSASTSNGIIQLINRQLKTWTSSNCKAHEMESENLPSIMTDSSVHCFITFCNLNKISKKRNIVEA